jgi:hypothetical protein
MNKKSSILDVGYMVVLIFVLALVFLAFKSVWVPSIDIMKNNTAFINNTDAQAALTKSQDLTNRFDYVIFISLIAFFLSIIIVSWYVQTDSIFAIVYFVALIIFIILSLIFSYVWDQYIITIPVFQTALISFPITNYILENFGIITSVIGFTGMILLFAKGQS